MTMRPPAYISLSEALSWLAFGQRDNRKVLNSELAGGLYGLDRPLALHRMKLALEALATRGHAGQVELQGKWHETSDLSQSATTVQIPPIKLADYTAFDITTDGLRFGKGLLWLGEGMSYQHTPLAKEGHFSEVAVKVTDLQRYLKPMFQAPKKPSVAQAKLKSWYDGLSPTEQGVPLIPLWDAAQAAFPANTVTRASVRALAPARTRGRPRNSP